MQKAFLCSNKVTQVREYLEHRSIISVEEEHRSLAELDLEHLGIIDVDKFIYLYYASDDGDLAFRTDLNVLRNLLSSAFFHVDEGIFVLIDCKNPMLEDLIHSATRGTTMVGPALQVIHHVGALTLSDVSRYIAGTTIGSETSSSYKAVYIKEADTEEKARFEHAVEDGLVTVLPSLTDQYSMYKKRAEVEAISSGHSVTDTYTRPQTMKDFPKRALPAIKRWSVFLQTGDEFTKFEKGTGYLVEYLTRIGSRILVIDMTSKDKVQKELEHFKCATVTIPELTSRKSFVEKAGYLRCTYNQFGYVVQTLDNVEGIVSYIIVCDTDVYDEIQEMLQPLCRVLYSSYTTHFLEECVKEYLNKGYHSTTLFLSRAVMAEQFSIGAYKDQFTGTRVALLELEDSDTTDYYECATGGGM